MKIIKNKVKCKHCGDILESNFEHDYQKCSCGAVIINGGHTTLKRICTSCPSKDFEELSECED